MSTLKVNAVTDASGGNTATINSMTPTADSLQGFRNRIINGDMRIDQRNAGASVTPANDTYTLDRWKSYQTTASKFSVQRNAGSVTPPVGFTNYLGATSLSAYSVSASDFYTVQQPMEGYNTADFGWGTANAKTITLSFWVRSSLTGTFGGAVFNADGTRSYPFTYTVSSANTWEYETITIAGDTSGSWGTTNGISLQICFSLGAGSTYSGTAGAWAGTLYTSATGAVSVVGTNGATFYITGVQLEVGSVATPFERRDYGRELMMCQRYYYRNTAPSGSQYGSGYNDSTANAYFNIPFPVTMRTSPTALEQSGTAGNYAIQRSGDFPACTSVPVFDSANTQSAFVRFTSTGNLTAGQGSSARSANSAGYLGWSAEL